MKRGLLSVLIVVGLVGLVGAACGNGSDGSSPGGLPKLPGFASSGDSAGRAAGGAAATTGAPANAMAADESTAVAPAMMPIQQVEYRLGAGVDALDGKAPAYRIEADASAAAAKRLADAFSVTGEPAADGGGGWQVGGGKAGGKGLYLSAQGMFGYFDEAAQSMTVSSGVAVACPPDVKDCAQPSVPPTTTTVKPDLPSEDAAVKEARSLLQAAKVDLDGATAHVDSFDSGVAVRFDRKLGDLPALGWEAYVTFGDKSAVQSASGWIGTATKLGDYPLAGTKAAFERSKQFFGGDVRAMASDTATATASAGAAGAAEPAIAQGEPAPGQPMPPETVPSEPTTTLPPKVIELTEAQLVLTVQYGRCPGDPIYLVPGYRFRSAGEKGENGEDTWTYGAVPAVTDQYLADTGTPTTADDAAAKDAAARDAAVEPCPGTPTGATGSGSGGGSSGSSGGGQSTPGAEPTPPPDAPTATQVDPAPPKPTG